MTDRTMTGKGAVPMGMKIMAAMLMLVALAACGKRGPPAPPGPPDQITYPRAYPAY